MIKAVMIDSREPAAIQKLTFGGQKPLVTELDTGDLWVACDDGAMLVIERKTVSDLLNSIKDNRLFQQAAALRRRSVWAYVIVTGTLAPSLDGHVITDSRSTQWRFDDVQGALLTVQELGVNVIHCQSDAHFEETVIRLAKRKREPEKLLAPRTNGRVMTPAEQILASLPGIGAERAQVLIEEFDGRACDALAWLTWLGTWREVSGIGDVTKQNIRRALGLGDDEWITVFYPEAVDYAKQHLETEEQSNEQRTANGDRPAARPDANGVANDRDDRTGDERQPTFRSGDRGASRGDHGKGLRVGSFAHV